METDHNAVQRDLVGEALDEALELTFPASDPIAVAAAVQSEKASDAKARQAGWQ